jgi:glycosyltransferase involved in cell wall biosynthesis
MEKKEAIFKIGIVVPCYNEAKRILLEEFANHIQTNPNHSFCFVNDGSNDGTLELLEQFSILFPNQVYVLNNDKNLGKAETVRNGVNYLFSLDKFDIIGFLDADLATPLFEIEKTVKLFENSNKLIVFGSRIKHLGGNVERKFIRYLLGRIFATIVSNWLLKTPVYDTQCGFKFFKKSIIESIFAKEFISKWFFDIELFCRTIQTYKNTDINEIAQERFLTTWRDVKGSKIKLSDYFKVPFELIKLKKHYRM